jgi:hypothetical protein
MDKKPRTPAKKPTVSKPIAEPKKVVSAAKINPVFIALQIKAEVLVDQYMNVMAEKMKESSMNPQTIQSVQAWTEAIRSLMALGLIVHDRVEPEQEPDIEPESNIEDTKQEELLASDN